MRPRSSSARERRERLAADHRRGAARHRAEGAGRARARGGRVRGRPLRGRAGGAAADGRRARAGLRPRGRRPTRPLPAGARLLVEAGRRPGDHARQEVLPAADLLRDGRPGPADGHRGDAARERARGRGRGPRISRSRARAPRANGAQADIRTLSQRADGIEGGVEKLQLGPRLARLERQTARSCSAGCRPAGRRSAARSGGRLRLRDLRGALPPGGVGARAPAAIRRAAAGQEARRRPRLRTRRADRDAEGRGRRCLRRGDRPRLRLAPRGEGDRSRGQGRGRASLRAGGRLGRRRRRVAPRRAPSSRRP